MNYYQEYLERMEKKKEGVEKINKHFSNKISKDTEKFVDNCALSQSRYLFERKEEVFAILPGGLKRKIKKYIGYCTCCKSEYELDERIKHNEYTKCKKCNKKLKVKELRYKRKNLIDAATMLIYDKSVIDKNAVVAYGYYVERDYSGDYKNVNTRYVNIARYLFKEGEEPVMLTNGGYWWENEKYEFRKTSTIYTFNINSLKKFRYFVNYNSFKKAIKDTPYQYCPYERYSNDDMLRIMELYTTHPVIEKLIKTGFLIIADYMYYRKSLLNQMNWRSNDLFKFLKIDRADLKVLKNQEVTPEFLKIYKNYKNKLTLKEIKEIVQISNMNYYALSIIEKFIGLDKAYRYLKKQWKGKGYFEKMNLLITYKDYLKQCKAQNIDLSKNINLYPRDLQKRHDDIMKEAEIKKNKKYDNAIKKRAKKLVNKYSYKNKKLLIRPAMSVRDLVTEGNTLNHCVAKMYTDRYARGETDILFIRKLAEPDKPYFTMEVKNGRIIQVQGYADKESTKPVEPFVEEFKRNVLV